MKGDKNNSRQVSQEVKQVGLGAQTNGWLLSVQKCTDYPWGLALGAANRRTERDVQGRKD